MELDEDDSEYVNLEILDEALDDTETFPDVKIEFLDEGPLEMKTEELDDTDQVVITPKIDELKKRLKHESGNIIFCKMPQKKPMIGNSTSSKTRKKPYNFKYHSCCKCTETFFSIDDAEKHFIENHPDCERYENDVKPTEHQCKFCLKYFQSYADMRKHRMRKQLIPSFQFRCPLCNEAGFNLHEYKCHGESNHGTDATYICSECGLSYKNFNSFTSHIYIKHKNEQNNVCSECGKSYARKSYLEQHYLVDHEGRRDFKCDECGVRFKRLCNLKSHMRVHTGEKPFQCADCPKKYSHYIDLKTHIAYRHTGVFKYNCSVCGKGFVKPSQLKIHMGRHGEARTAIKLEVQ